MTSVLQMMRFKQGSLGLSDPSLFLPGLVLCLAASLWAKTASGAGPPAQPGDALALQGQGPTSPASVTPYRSHRSRMSRAVAPRCPVSMRLTLDGEHRSSAATCSTVRSRSLRSARSILPSSRLRTVGLPVDLRASGTGGRFLPHELSRARQCMHKEAAWCMHWAGVIIPCYVPMATEYVT